MLFKKTPIGENIAGFDYSTQLLNYTARLWYIDADLMKRVGGFEEKCSGSLQEEESALEQEMEELYKQNCLLAFSQTFFPSQQLSNEEREWLVKCCLKANHTFSHTPSSVGLDGIGNLENIKSFTMQNVYSVTYRDTMSTWTTANENNLTYLLPCLVQGINRLTADTSSSLARN